jgi:hypothetical protein
MAKVPRRSAAAGSARSKRGARADLKKAHPRRRIFLGMGMRSRSRVPRVGSSTVASASRQRRLACKPDFTIAE